jgi:hypothetical protein
MVSSQGKELQTQEVLFSTQNYRDITSFSDAIKLLESSGVDLVSAEDLGDGFSVADKSTLVGVPMVCLTAMIRTGDMGEYVVCRNVAKDGRKVVVVDGSTGLKDQLVDYMETHNGNFPRRWDHGLRVSKYTFYDNSTDKDIPAETYYLDTSA